jgi:quinol monooxygenase YgiN
MRMCVAVPGCHDRSSEEGVMLEPILYIDRSRINPGRVDDVKRLTIELAEFIEKREGQLLFYGFSIDEDAQRMTVLAVHPDTESVERHMDVGRQAFREFADLIVMEAIEIYGKPSDRVREQLDRKARDLGGNVSVTIGSMHAGFSRLAELNEAAVGTSE